jgi:hypothetical protein
MGHEARAVDSSLATVSSRPAAGSRERAGKGESVGREARQPTGPETRPLTDG